MNPRRVSIAIFVLATASIAAAAPASKPIPAVCKADLKAWSAQKTETLTIEQLQDRMNEMYACAEQSKKHEKQVWAYLTEFYRTHSELAGRAFDFIAQHGLAKQFGEEKNGTVAEAKSDPK
jgi:hypothetical protein